jgi:hypothetical protein
MSGVENEDGRGDILGTRESPLPDPVDIPKKGEWS